MRAIFCFFLSILFFKGFSQINLANGLVASYPFNGNANDASGNSHNGVLVNSPQLAADRFGNANSAYLFDGIDDYIRITDNGSFSTPQFSIVLWFQSHSDNLQNLVGKRNFTTTAGSGAAQYQFFINYPPFPGIGSNLVGNNSSCSNIASSSYINTTDWICRNKWYCAVVTFDGTSHKIYIDGILKKNVPATFTAMLSCNSDLRLGNWWQGDLIPFKGVMDDVRWYNRALNQQEVTALYNNFPTLSGPCGLNAGAAFLAPDTVCVNTPVNIANTSTGASSYYWNFCVANSLTNPVGTNIGGAGNLSLPVFCDYGKDGNNYYAFVTNNVPGKLVRLSFGNSLLNAPTYTDFGDLGGAIPNQCEGIQLVYNEGKWYAIIVGGQPVGRIVKVEFGTSLGNNSPVATNWGNVGNLAYPTDLHVFQDGGNWYGLTLNSQTNSITRFSFSNSFSNTPTGINLGALGGMNYPTGIYAVSKGGLWHAFITNAGTGVSNSTDASLTRLDFGTSLLNTPTGINIGNPANALSSPRDLTIYQSCNEIFGYVAGNASGKELVRLNFNNSLTAVPSANIIGNTGGLNFPHSVSKLFRVNSDLYAFITNVNNNTITRLQFAGCTNASVASSTLQNPPSVTYNAAGTYNINLTVDEGLATQAAFCKQVVVVPPPTVVARPDTAICPGSFAVLTTTSTNATKFSWSPSTGLSDATSPNPVASPALTTQYIVTATNGGGCSTTDTVVVTVKTPQQCTTVVVNAGFTAPDTVCVNTPVKITNTSTNASTYYWNFCVANSLSAPAGTNLGVNSNFSLPVFSDYVKDGNNYYAFVTNNMPGKLTKLDFGNSLLNAPVYTDFGNLGGVIPDQCEGIQIVKNEGKWYAIIVGGQPSGRIVKVEFGSSLANNSPLATNWGNIGSLAYPTDLHIFQDGANWYGLTLNSQTNSITRFSFSNSFSNTPTGINLGSFGGMNYPTGIYAIAKNGSWHAFITNAGTGAGNSTDASLTRLDFGASLLNNPTGINLGNPGNALSSPRDLTIYQSCNEIFGYVVGNASNKELVRLNFNNSLTVTPTASVIGNIGGLNFPHSISKLFRDSSDLYTFITNVNSNSVTRLKFSGCNTASISSSTLQSPPVITYSTPGTYNINLTIDDGLPTQAVVCKQVVVVPNTHTPLQQKTFCSGDSVLLTSTNATNNQWSTGSTANSIYATAPGTYWVQSVNSGGCINIDSFAVTVKPKPVVALGKDTAFCSGDSLVLNAGNTGAGFLWQNGQTTQSIVAGQSGLYHVAVTLNGCTSRDSIAIDVRALPVISLSNDTMLCKPGSANLVAGGGTAYSWWPVTGLSNTTTNSTTATPDTTTKYYVTVTNADNCVAKDSVTVKVFPTPVVRLGKDTSLCTLDSLVLDAGNAGATYVWQNGQTAQTILVKAAGLYHVAVTKDGCTGRDSVFIEPLASPVITLSNDTALCIPGAATLNAAGGSVYSWSPATGLSNPAGASTTASPDTTTTYYLTVAGSNGCKAKDSVTITVFPTPVVQLGGDTSFCSLDSLVLDAGNAGAAYLWQNGQSTQTLVAKQAGKYLVTVTANGCSAKDSVTLSVKPSPVITLTGDTSICKKASVLLQGGGGTTYQWWPVAGLSDTTSASILAKPDTTTTYYLQIANSDNCLALDSVTITVDPAPVFSVRSSKPLICDGDTATLSATGGDAYSWSPATWLSNPTDSTTEAYPDTTTLYKVMIDHFACRVRDSLFIRLPFGRTPIITLAKSNDINCFQGQATLSASGGNSYLWQPSLGLSDPRSKNPTVSVAASTTYVLTAVSADGCRAQDSITVFVNKGDDGSGFPVPSAFTPNNDGKNDCFSVKHWGLVTKFSLNLYNRWGELVFHADDPSQCWDGYYKGVLQPNAVFVYWIEANTICGKVFRKGTFTLIR